jgi:small subunit ribosomal protein S7
MARRREVPKRVILPDPKFKDLTVTKFVNCMMKHGKKQAAEGAFYGAIEIIDSKGPKFLAPSKTVWRSSSLLLITAVRYLK